MALNGSNTVCKYRNGAGGGFDGRERGLYENVVDTILFNASAVVHADVRVHSRSSNVYSESFNGEIWDWD